MRKLILTLISMTLIQNAQAVEIDNLLNTSELKPPIFGGDASLFPVIEEPGPNAVNIDQVIHSKTISVLGSEIKFKWTEVGYGALTYKVIVPSLAAHTLFNHRNPGEEGPCLRSYRRSIPGIDFEGSSPEIQANPESIIVNIEAINRYRVDHEKRVCKVYLVEHVETVVDEEVFNHTYTKDMGFRLIDDCLIESE